VPEPKFKVGDRVKFTPAPGCIAEVTKVAVWRNYSVADMPPGYWYSVRARADGTAICQCISAAAHEEWLELVEQQKPAIWPWIILGILILIGRRKKK